MRDFPEYEPDARVIHAFIEREGWDATFEGVRRQVCERSAPPATRASPQLGALRSFDTGWGKFTTTVRQEVQRWVAPPRHPANKRTSPERALELAQAFAERHVADLGTRYEPPSCELMGDEYAVVWERALPPGAVSIYANQLSVTVERLHRRVTRFVHDDLYLTRTEPPRLGLEDARARMRQLTGADALGPLELYEWPLAGGERVQTLWEAVAYTKGEGPAGLIQALCRIDADTGEPFDAHNPEAGRPLRPDAASASRPQASDG